MLDATKEIGYAIESYKKARLAAPGMSKADRAVMKRNIKRQAKKAGMSRVELARLWNDYHYSFRARS